VQPNLAQTYYRDEQQKNRQPRPWLYWLIFAGVAAVAAIAIELV
jgi:hypothetical protein